MPQDTKKTFKFKIISLFPVCACTQICTGFIYIHMKALRFSWYEKFVVKAWKSRPDKWSYVEKL